MLRTKLLQDIPAMTVLMHSYSRDMADVLQKVSYHHYQQTKMLLYSLNIFNIYPSQCSPSIMLMRTFI